MGVGGQFHTPAALPPGKRPGTHCIGGWVGPMTCLDGCEKSRKFDPRTVQSVGRRYTDYAIPAHTSLVKIMLSKEETRVCFAVLDQSGATSVTRVPNSCEGNPGENEG
jgi:hypothetical protein